MMLPGEQKRELLVKAECQHKGYGKDPYKRSIAELLDEGVINLDKPYGPTSHEVTAWVKNILHIKRAGHSGTLDPHVTGVLPIMLGDATRLVRVLLLSGKEYVCVMRLHADLPEEKVRAILEEFTGVIYQRPPLVSAVKRQLRKRTIYYIDFLEMRGRDVLFKVGCEAGTYIRKLCHDMGEALGVGAHMYELRRTKSGPFKEDETLITLHDLTDAYYYYTQGDEAPLRKIILPMEYALRNMPRIIVKDSAVGALAEGAPLFVQGVCKVDTGIRQGDTVAVFTHMGEVVSIGTARMSTEELMAAKEGQALDTLRVMMKPGVYPPEWKKKLK
ncbi:RNA-guided pseudouridylation complex pseudouridine synthase subunit Cbf5 [Methanocella conradii]|uniref:RNA-guided pseudouridylation complex pseudouridine synthase subunit Cbf5 n=1 Tax=Methanocella conradii TaxID=1175444 RepID=UPI0024B3BFDA|nr:RNA-guided pseudouridylation complex pseudouridine synthase subunit Cbf5 [Methanocella conradii]MDI6896079.1 RNA-guided pseudouridylation complex pseudouridine synthase subunit Cbf5 [Methanocella conradii]